MSNSSTWGRQAGSYQQKAVMQYRIQNKAGMLAEIYNLGGIISKIMVRGKDGEFRNVVFGFDDFRNYIPNLDHHIGSIVGRYANRIGGASFVIDGHRFQLAANEGQNILHGGKNNLSKRFWEVEELAENKITLTITSADGDQGFPGELHVRVDITVSELNELILQYEARSSKGTHVCFTQHGYFNLAGSPSSVLNHYVWVNADKITETDKLQIPTGNFLTVKKTGYDLTKPISIKEIIQKNPEGLDNNFVLNNFEEESNTPRKAAGLYEPDSGILMEVFTTEPGLQVYTANHLHKIVSPFGIPNFPAICLEAQHFPDSPNKPQFPSTLLMPNQNYKQETRYNFSIKE